MNSCTYYYNQYVNILPLLGVTCANNSSSSPHVVVAAGVAVAAKNLSC
jgi:hypothetical protein